MATHLAGRDVHATDVARGAVRGVDRVVVDLRARVDVPLLGVGARAVVLSVRSVRQLDNLVVVELVLVPRQVPTDRHPHTDVPVYERARKRRQPQQHIEALRGTGAAYMEHGVGGVGDGTGSAGTG